MKILFVDVDGPLIPSSEFLLDKMCSLDRRIPKLQIAMLNAICERTGAKVVMNTTHNIERNGLWNIRDSMVFSGFNPEYSMIFPLILYIQAAIEALQFSFGSLSLEGMLLITFALMMWFALMTITWS